LASYSLRGYRRVQLEETFNGSSGRKRLAGLARHLTSLRLTASFSRVAANLVLMVAMIYLVRAPAHGWVAVAGAVAAAAGVVAVFGVGIPHAWADHAGDRALAAVLPVLQGMRYALWPVVMAMKAFDVPVRRLAGVGDEPDENGEAARQEILQAATEGQAEGAVDADDVEMIESVIEFGEQQAGEIMTPRTDVFALPASTAWEEAAARIVEAGHTRVPIYQGDLDSIIGVLYAKDLLRFAGSEQPPPLREIMRKCYYVPETIPLDELLRAFKGRKVHLAVVLDEYGGTAGIVTVEDVIEEIVGDISDEYDRPAPALMEKIDAATAEVDGRLHIDDLNDALGLAVPEDQDYDTVAGLVFSELGYIPTVGEELEAYGARFKVLAADERKIRRLKVKAVREG
jgi:putative hemolysin